MTAEAPERARATESDFIALNSDDCVHDEMAHLIARHFGEQPVAESRYYLTTYLPALTADPGYLASRLGRAVIVVGARPFAAVATDYWIRYDDPVLLVNAETRPLYRSWMDRHHAPFSGQVDLLRRRWLFGSRLFFAGAGALLCAPTVVAAACLVLPPARPPHAR